jgi:hypothetical protein
MNGEESELANQPYDPGMIASRDGMRARDLWEMDTPRRQRWVVPRDEIANRLLQAAIDVMHHDITDAASVRIEILGGARALTIPLDLVLCVDAVLKEAHREEEPLDLDVVEDDETGWRGWQARLGNALGCGDTPWSAIVALARAIQ